MNLEKPYSTLRLLIRSLLPSPISALGCLVAGIFLVIIHVLSLSLDFGTFLPSIFDGEFAASYTHSIVQPLVALLGGAAFNKILLIVLWSIAGLVFYGIFSYGAHIYRAWHKDERNIGIRQDRIVYHPQRKNFELHAAWRLSIGVCAAALLYAAQPLFRRLLRVDNNLFVQQVNGAAIFQLIEAILVWAIVFHIVVVLFRLYLFKTRVFGDLLYLRAH